MASTLCAGVGWTYLIVSVMEECPVHHVPKSRQILVDSRRTALLKPCDLESLDRGHVYLRDLYSKKFEKRFRTHPIPLMSRGFILGLRPRQEPLNELGEVRGFL
jgi:hypothetical protein